MSVIMPGSYDPVTLGHLDMIRRVAERGDEVYAVIFTNPNKEYTFSLEDRVRMLLIATEDIPNVTVSYSLGRVVDYMREHDISRIVKGYRDESDLPWEREQAEYNLKHGGYETELIAANEEYRSISSTAAREAIRRGADLTQILPRGVIEYIAAMSE
ncbi:MAG: pantetheine-phosphate adenylyltransferase [Clostridia bacterium]|nr:pantetheine-phosphate adenylyltransferase [Clostridia bacterium]